jgi:hypothetical protein
MKQYVLGKFHPEFRGTMLIGGSHPKMPMFHPDLEYARKFGSVEEALAFRMSMDHQLGGTDKYHVHEVQPDGGLLDLEA